MSISPSPRPWRFEREWKPDNHDPDYDGSVGALIDANGNAVLWFGIDGEEDIYCPRQVDHDHLLLCVNTHDALLAAAKALIEDLDGCCYNTDEAMNFRKVVAAIAAAEGEV